MSLHAARAVAIGGTALLPLPALWLAPMLAAFDPGTTAWRSTLLIGSLVASIGVGLWSVRALPAGPRDAARRRAALDFPLRLTRILFAASVVAGLGSLPLLAPIMGASDAILPALVSYLMLLLPTAGLYFLTSILLRGHSTTPPGEIPAAGLRQSITLRLSLAVQLPVLLCALGMILVEQTSGVAYEQRIEAYARERYGRTLDRMLKALPGEARHQVILQQIQPPEGILVFEGVRGRRTWTVSSAGSLAGRPVSLLVPLLLLALVVVALTLLHGRWLAREVVAELRSVQHALDAMQADAPRAATEALTGTLCLRETAELAMAVERALAGFEARQLALQAAAAERRTSERAKARFLGHLSHELKSPLNSILGFSELLLAGIDGPLRPRQRDQLAAVWRQGESLERFILALLDATRLGEAGRDASLLEPGPIGTRGLATTFRDHCRPDPLDTLRIDVVEVGEATCRVDAIYTARALRLTAGLLIDRMEAGLIEVRLAPGERGVVVTVAVQHAQADPADLESLVDALRSDAGPEADARAGAVPATRLLWKALQAAQGGTFSVVYGEPGAWPSFRLELPG
ncbi:MAG: HAMP domain-containing histidine kinase [Myxococcales bacterium]|nr:HAMP domain-containing histidine kinase [Myxococcales bacterium]